ncbi:Uma2 family endonuclease [Nitrospira sp. M1]
MPTTASSHKFTYKDYLGFPDDGNRHELIHGEHYETPAPLTKHQRISSNLLAHIHHHCQQNNAGLVLAAPTDVVFSEADVVQPDLVFIANARQRIVTRENIQGAPDFIVEILSDSTRRRDERTKRTLYERHQVTEYWIIDPELETVKIFRLKESRYVMAEETTTEQPKTSLSTPLLPGLSITLSDVFS